MLLNDHTTFTLIVLILCIFDMISWKNQWFSGRLKLISQKLPITTPEKLHKLSILSTLLVFELKYKATTLNGRTESSLIKKFYKC